VRDVGGFISRTVQDALMGWVFIAVIVVVFVGIPWAIAAGVCLLLGEKLVGAVLKGILGVAGFYAMICVGLMAFHFTKVVAGKEKRESHKC